MDAIARPGVWKRSGMRGLISGLDIGEALASLPCDCDRDLARRLFIRAEVGFLSGVVEREDKEKQDGRE